MARLFVALDYLTVTDAASLDASAAVTIDAWVFITDSNPKGDSRLQGHVCSKFQSGDGSYGLIFNQWAGGSKQGVEFLITDTTQFFATVNSAISENVWYHLSGSYDGTTVRARQWNSVTRATLGATTAHTGSIDTNADDIGIGQALVLATNTRFSIVGSIANVRIWNGIGMSDAQLDQLKFLPHGPTAFSKASELPMWLPLEGFSDPERDLSGTGNTGATTVGTSESSISPPFFQSSGQILQFPPAVVGGGEEFLGRQYPQGVNRGIMRGVA